VAHSEVRRLDLPADPASVGRARRFVRTTLEDWELDQAVELATLLVSELATNAVLHARTAYAVEVTRGAADVRVEVFDGSAVAPRQRANSASAATGRGVALIDRLATSWGTQPAGQQGFAKSVWFTVTLAEAGASAWGGDWLEGL
jgi:anti-sigma regulatory factor (Ser/Thr protein kinase)